VYRRLAQGSLVEVDGGEHIVMTDGIPCAESLVAEFLVSGAAPAKKETTCSIPFENAYVPLVPARSATLPSAVAVMGSLDDELFALPEFLAWDRSGGLAVGCKGGGGAMFGSLEEGSGVAGIKVTLDACSIAEGLAISGSGTLTSKDAVFTFDARISGDRTGTVHYARDAEGRSTTGELHPAT
jgi:hypothetical protein